MKMLDWKIHVCRIIRMGRASKTTPKQSAVKLFVPGERKIRLLHRLLELQRKNRYAAFQAGDGAEALRIETRMVHVNAMLENLMMRS